MAVVCSCNDGATGETISCLIRYDEASPVSGSAMRRPPLLVTIAMVLFAGAFAQADDFLFSRFSDYLDALRIQAGIPGLAAAIIGPGSVSWEGAFGQQDVERNINVTIDTPFELD